jgi:hypothetical protein
MSTNYVYAINKTATNLVLKGGYLTIPRDGFKRIREADQEHETVIHALDADWLEISETEPVIPATERKVSIVGEVVAYQGLTIDELRAQGVEELKRPVGKVTAIGRPTPVQEPELATEATAEILEGVAKVRGRKAAEKAE